MTPMCCCFCCTIFTCGNIQARVWMDARKVFNNTRRHINISQIIMEESNPSLFDALLGFHAFTGGDFIAPFFGKGKQRPLERMKKIPGCMEAFAALDMHPTVPGHVMSTLESFVCAMYARPKMGSVNKARYDIFERTYAPKKPTSNPLQQIKGINPTSLPPCSDVLSNKIKRTNLVTWVWKHACRQDPSTLNQIRMGGYYAIICMS